MRFVNRSKEIVCAWRTNGISAAQIAKSFPPCPGEIAIRGCGAQRQQSERHCGGAYLLARLLVFFFGSHSNHLSIQERKPSAEFRTTI